MSKLKYTILFTLALVSTISAQGFCPKPCPPTAPICCPDGRCARFFRECYIDSAQAYPTRDTRDRQGLSCTSSGECPGGWECCKVLFGIGYCSPYCFSEN